MCLTDTHNSNSGIFFNVKNRKHEHDIRAPFENKIALRKLNQWKKHQAKYCVIFRT